MSTEDDPRNNAESTRRQMPEGKRFAPGNPGRPKGSRNKLGEEFIQALYADFKEHGAETIEAVRLVKPDQYLKVVASILPKEVKVTTESDLDDAELDRRIRQLAAALNLEIRGEGGTGEADGGEGAQAEPQSPGSVSTLQ